MTSLLFGLGAGAALVALYSFWRSAFRIENGNVGVLVRFGRLVRDATGRVTTFPPGLHAKAPWVRATEISLAERSMSLEEHGGVIEVLAPDGTRIRVNARLRFHVAQDRVAAFLAESKDAVEELRGLFRVTVREQIARFEPTSADLSAYTALRSRMNELQQRTLEALQESALHEYGIAVIAVDYLQIDPPEELVDALNAVITAESEANALVARTALQCLQRSLAAAQAVEIANAHALAVEDEIRTVGHELISLAERGVLRDYVDRRRAEVLGHSRRVYLNHQPTRSQS
ncbi:MAG: SPFH domain-containing protein [Deltaproteobacteria bacterium]|nr:SPFH domain-containing protein [Deltaproteobacteria bacterium]